MRSEVAISDGHRGSRPYSKKKKNTATTAELLNVRCTLGIRVRAESMGMMVGTSRILTIATFPLISPKNLRMPTKA